MSEMIDRDEVIEIIESVCSADDSYWKPGTLEKIRNLPTHPTPSNTLGALDCVERQKAIDEIRKCRFVVDAIEKIKDLPAAEPRKGKWIEGRDERFVKCSECGMESTKNALMGIALFGEKEPHFCPNCGAMMEEGDADDRNNRLLDDDNRNLFISCWGGAYASRNNNVRGDSDD